MNARNGLRLAFVFAGFLGALAILGAPVLSSVGRVWIWPALLAGLVAGLGTRGPVREAGLTSRLPWPAASMVAWLAWAAGVRVALPAAWWAIGYGEADLGNLSRTAALAALALAPASIGLGLALTGLLSGAARHRFAATLAATHLLAAATVLAFARTGHLDRALLGGAALLTCGHLLALRLVRPSRSAESRP